MTAFNYSMIKRYRSGNINSTMKTFILPVISALLLLLGASEGCIVPECPENSNDDATYFASPTDCTKYYICVHNEPVQMSCPLGLWFDDQLDVCNYPEVVNCDPSKYIFSSFSYLHIFKNTLNSKL